MKKSNKAINDDNKDNRNQKTSDIQSETLTCNIVVVDQIANNSLGEFTDVWGCRVLIDTSDGYFQTVFYGKNKAGAERMTRTVLKKLGVKYRIKK